MFSETANVKDVPYSRGAFKWRNKDFGFGLFKAGPKMILPFLEISTVHEAAIGIIRLFRVKMQIWFVSPNFPPPVPQKHKSQGDEPWTLCSKIKNFQFSR
jgi:hypothetical protein